MKARLYKTGNEYFLKDLNGEVLAITNGSTEGRKLSKQNCDEIFATVDVEKLADELYSGHAMAVDWQLEKSGFIKGFNKAMELNKDKVFTLEDIIKAWDAGVMSRSIISMFNGELYKNKLKQHRDAYIQSLQQTTEIEVEIVLMKDNEWYEKYQGNPPRHFKIQHNQLFDGDLPKLDSENCLILTKLINP